MESTILVAHSYGTSDVLEFESHQLPPLAKGMARIQVKVAGINPIDARRMTGEFKHAALPQTFGTEYAGIIVDLADQDTSWAIGDDVLGSGGAFTHATVIDVPLANLVKKPKQLDWAVAGTLAGGAQTAMTILDEIGNVKSLLIHGGSGGVGSILIQIAKAKGIAVVATASAKNQDYIAQLGATPVVYGAGLTERLQHVHPDAFDASVDMIGNEDATQASLATVKPDGVLASIAGRALSSNRIKAIWVKRNVANLQYVVDGVASGQFHWEVSRQYPFSQAPQAFADILDGHTKGKSALVFA